LSVWNRRLEDSFNGGKAAGSWGWLVTSSYHQGQECVELYLHFPFTFLVKHRDNHTTDIFSCFGGQKFHIGRYDVDTFHGTSSVTPLPLLWVRKMCFWDSFPCLQEQSKSKSTDLLIIFANYPVSCPLSRCNQQYKSYIIFKMLAFWIHAWDFQLHI